MSNEMVHGNIIGGVGTKRDQINVFILDTSPNEWKSEKESDTSDEDDDKNKRK